MADELSPLFRNVETSTAYVGDEACATCHADAASAYRSHAMARSFHPWEPDTRIEAPLTEPIFHAPTGFYYSVIEVGDELHQEEFLIGMGGQRLHELRRRIDYVMGSGAVARTYFTEENGRLFQLPLTWYEQGGWDFSPGYELSNARFDRLMPDRCLTCHGSYPEPFPHLEGKYAELSPGIGCERCHGPGALHVTERSSGESADSTYDDTIVNPEHLPFERRLDVCQQCHVHTPVTVLREGQDAFSYMPSQPLRDHAAFFKTTGDIDIVSHADRLRQSACFVATRPTEQPLECATCHNPHRPPPDLMAQNQPCRDCHATLDLQQRLTSPTSLADHTPTANCVGCHMPKVKERAVPHGSFTEHWIRVIAAEEQQTQARRADDRPIEPYFERDRTGPDAALYQAMGEVIYANLATNARILVDAATALDRALGTDTTRGDAQFLLGVAYQQLGRTDDAIGALERAVRIDADRPAWLHALAQAYESAETNPAGVDSLYVRALTLQPALAWIRADYAHFLHSQGLRVEAEETYRSALAERPSLDAAAFNLGMLLIERGRLGEASEVLQEAVRLDPTLAEALSPLLQIRTVGNTVTGARFMGSPLITLPVRDRGPAAPRLTIGRGNAGPGVLFVNVPPGVSVRIHKPGGAVVRTLPPGEGSTLMWDLLTEAGTPISGGLYQARLEGNAASGSPFTPQLFSFGVVRLRAG